MEDNKKKIRKHQLQSLYDESAQRVLLENLISAFKSKELFEICETIPICTLNPIREIDEAFINIFIYNKGFNVLLVNDILQLNTHPSLRYIEVVIRYKSFSVVWFYNYSHDIYYVLFKIITDAYNYSAYCKDYDDSTFDFLYKHYVDYIYPIIENYIDTVAFKRMKNFLLKFHVTKKSKNLLETFQLSDKIHIEVFTITNSIMRLSINNKSDRYCIYLERGFNGIAQLRLILDTIEEKYKMYTSIES